MKTKQVKTPPADAGGRKEGGMPIWPYDFWEYGSDCVGNSGKEHIVARNPLDPFKTYCRLCNEEFDGRDKMPSRPPRPLDEMEMQNYVPFWETGNAEASCSKDEND